MRFQKFSDSQKRLGAVVFALAAGASVLLTVKSINLHQPVVATTAQPIAHAELPAAQAVISHVESRLDSKIASAGTFAVNGAIESSTEMPAQASWQMASVKAETPSIPLNEKISDYAIVELSQKPAAFPAVGEQISLPMLHGKVLVAKVESATKLLNGDYTWSGHVEGYGTDYPVVMTYGEHSVFATITTPEGSYTMESINGLGWLYKNPAEVELSHPGAKDFLEIEPQH